MKKPLLRVGAAIAASAVLTVGASALLAPAASAVVVRPVVETASASSTATTMEFRAMAGTVSTSASYYDSVNRVTGIGTVKAPAGTTIQSVTANTAPANPYTISADKKTAVAERSVAHGAGATTVTVGLAFDKGLPANAYTATAGSFVISIGGNPLLTVPIRAFVLSPSKIPAATGTGVPGGSTSGLVLYDPTTQVAGTMTITAPAKTTIAAVRDNLGGTFSVSPDRRTATSSTTSWGGGRATAVVTVSVDPDAAPGTTLAGGSAVVKDSGTAAVVASGSISVAVAWPTALISPRAGGIIEPDAIFTGVGVPGAPVEIRDSSGTVVASTEVAADGTWSAASLAPLSDGENALTLVSGDVTVPLGSFVAVSVDTVDTPVVDPAIAGGAALALLAAAGSVLLVRRRAVRQSD